MQMGDEAKNRTTVKDKPVTHLEDNANNATNDANSSLSIDPPATFASGPMSQLPTEPITVNAGVESVPSIGNKAMLTGGGNKAMSTGGGNKAMSTGGGNAGMPTGGGNAGMPTGGGASAMPTGKVAPSTLGVEGFSSSYAPW